MSKKKHKIMQQEREHFIHGLRCEDGSIGKPRLRRQWDSGRNRKRDI